MTRWFRLIVLPIAAAMPVLLCAARNSAAPQAQGASSTPSVDEILAKYVQAIGGRAALEKVTTRVMKGTLELPPSGDTGSIVPGTIEIDMKAPNKRAVISNVPGNGVDQRGYNGSVGWYVDPDEGPKDLTGSDLDSMKLDAEFHRELNMPKLYRTMTVEGKATVGGRDAYVVDATLGSGDVEKLYFDAQSGLLVRDDSPVEIPDEGKTTQVSLLQDYRDVDGVKLPFTISRNRPDGDSTIKFTEIKNNVPLDDAKFNKPAAQK
ncbi:MAG TPA: hypothetical protein VG204_19775 [Terriglobia bacterium]|nr:hypothetical protein [Terriglobia bacterium]